MSKFMIQKVDTKHDRASKCSWPHWFTLADLESLREQIEKEIEYKKINGDSSWPYVYTIAKN